MILCYNMCRITERGAIHMRYNKESFLARVTELYHGKYDYSEMEYVNQSTKVKIICPMHGPFFRTPTYHMHGGDCPVCAKERSMAGCRKPMSEEAKEKRRKTNLERYGATTFAGSQAARDLHAQGLGCWTKESRKKAAETCMKHFGAKTWAESEEGIARAKAVRASEEVRKKMSECAKSPEARAHYKETSMAHCGVEHWTQSEQGRQRLHEMFSTDEERLARSERMLSPEVRAKIEATSMARYGVPYYWQSEQGRVRLKELLNSEEVIEKTKQTNLLRYGCETWQGSEEGRAKMASEDVRNRTEQTNYERYGAKTWSNTDAGKQIMSEKISSDEIQRKMIKTKRCNGTISDSQPERDAYALLAEKFGEDDVVAQYRCDRYPFKCDFYIKSLDLFIELNAYWMHGGHWFDADNPDDLERLQFWLSSPKPSYERAVYVWTVNDLEKRDMAKKCNLNYIVFWDNDLADMKAWVAKGCPISSN